MLWLPARVWAVQSLWECQAPHFCCGYPDSGQGLQKEKPKLKAGAPGLPLLEAIFPNFGDWIYQLSSTFLHNPFFLYPPTEYFNHFYHLT